MEPIRLPLQNIWNMALKQTKTFNGKFEDWTEENVKITEFEASPEKIVFW